jgi:hypothetical protein
MKNLLCLIGFVLFAHTVVAQEYKIQPAAGESIIPFATAYVGGNSYITSGYVYQGYEAGLIYRTDVASLAWATKVFAVSDLQGQTITSNGDVVSVGQANGDALIVRVTQNGSPVWAKTLGNAGSLEGLRGVAETLDGNLVAVGSIYNNFTLDRSEMVMKLDQNGNMLWSREVLPPFGSIDPQNYFVDVVIENDTIFAFGTRLHSLSPPDISIGKFSSDGNYAEFYTVGSVSDEIFCDVTMSGQEFVISCRVAGSNSYTGLIRLNSNLSMLASAYLQPTFPLTGTLGMSGGIVSSGSNLIIAGDRVVGTSSSFVAKVDQNFSPIWSETIEANAHASTKPILASMGQVMVVGNSDASLGAVMSAVDAGTGFPIMGNCEPPQAFAVTKTPTFLYSVEITRTVVPVNYTNIGTVALVSYQPGFDWCGASTLPIHLLSFTAVAVDHEVLLEWSTATEQNNEHFTIEKSRDGQSFEEVMTVDGAGNSTSVINYKEVDASPFTGQSYYRLRQTDFNGATTVSEMVSVTTEAVLVVSPNPLPSGITLRVPSETAPYHIYTASGVWVKTIFGSTNLDELPRGLYFIRSVDAPEVCTRLIVTF